ncbi:hypothetical protein M2480_000803 [Parabacteroides sp. PFB2-12]|uniref:hypothetical protein n=1 Tax=unclassified Parabacteroides TaxID=2649774 RepID=UPI002474FE9E|nr:MULTISPECIES: hypothetical protein [unclassified Parabacteroides]MDH6341740.1 hypothetical protein [Parabacteroides sp. PM6-13]MDH6389837.1 hypothetical protein [Parabacteroides sp. PFB2-12]
MRRFIYLSLLAVVATTLFCACSNDDNYSPGEQNDPNTMAVFFPTNNRNVIVLSNQDEYKIDILVSRLKSDQAATVPVKVIKKDEVFVVPESVVFQAGQAESTITVTFPSAETASYSFILGIEGKEYVDQYSIVDGHSQYDCTIHIEKWEVAISQATFGFASLFEPEKVDILKQDGLNRYKIVNYLKSGFDFVFSIDENMNIVPEGGHKPNANNWYFSAGNTAAYPVPKAGSEGLTITNFYVYVSVSGTHSFVDFTNKKGSVYHNNTYNNGTAGWNRNNFTWQ